VPVRMAPADFSCDPRRLKVGRGGGRKKRALSREIRNKGGRLVGPPAAVYLSSSEPIDLYLATTQEGEGRGGGESRSQGKEKGNCR